MEHKYSLLKSFGFAIEGLMSELKKGRNFRIQITVGLIVIMLGFFFGISPEEWLSLTITIALVLILELINTSIETIVDLASPEIHPKAKLAKDVAAGAVLVASIGAIVIGAIIFLPKLGFFI